MKNAHLILNVKIIFKRKRDQHAHKESKKYNGVLAGLKSCSSAVLCLCRGWSEGSKMQVWSCHYLVHRSDVHQGAVRLPHVE